MAINQPDVVRCAARGTFQGQQWVNVFHFQKRDESAVTASDLAALAGILDDAATDNDSLGHLYRNCDSGLLTEAFTLTSLGSGGNVPVTRETSWVQNGGSAGANDAQAMLAIIAKWSTGIASRRARGRTFFAGVHTGMFGSDPDYVASAQVTAFTTDWSAFVAAFMANTTWAFVVLSHVVEGAVELTEINEIISASINPTFGVQRRRRPRTAG